MKIQLEQKKIVAIRKPNKKEEIHSFSLFLTLEDLWLKVAAEMELTP